MNDSKTEAELAVGDWFVDPDRTGGRPAKVLEIRTSTTPGRLVFTLDDDTRWKAWSGVYDTDQTVDMLPAAVVAVLDVVYRLNAYEAAADADPAAEADATARLAAHLHGGPTPAGDPIYDMWRDVIERLDTYDRAGTERLDDEPTHRFVLTDGTVISQNLAEEPPRWHVVDPATLTTKTVTRDTVQLRWLDGGWVPDGLLYHPASTQVT